MISLKCTVRHSEDDECIRVRSLIYPVYLTDPSRTALASCRSMPLIFGYIDTLGHKLTLLLISLGPPRHKIFLWKSSQQKMVRWSDTLEQWAVHVHTQIYPGSKMPVSPHPVTLFYLFIDSTYGEGKQEVLEDLY